MKWLKGSVQNFQKVTDYERHRKKARLFSDQNVTNNHQNWEYSSKYINV